MLIYAMLLLLTGGSPLLLLSQETTNTSTPVMELFASERFDSCLKLLLKNRLLEALNENERLIAGNCYYELGKLPEAKQCLEVLLQKNPASPDVLLGMGRIQHASLDFLGAIHYYKKWLQSAERADPMRELIKDEILRCATGNKLLFSDQIALVENLGPGVNTQSDDFAPVLSPNYENRLYFASNRMGSEGGLRDDNGLPDPILGKIKSDMYMTISTDRGWQNANRLSTLLNSPANDIILDFDESGSVIYFFKGHSLFSGEMFADTFRTDQYTPLFPEKLALPAMSEYGDKDLFFFRDSVLLFASQREGGFGGYDLYFTVNKKGNWSVPVNLGPEINTPYDERSPFLCHDGQTLYFSTNNCRKSMGGFDLHKSVYQQKESRWTPSRNLGPGLNSPADDLYLRMSWDGVQAYFASDRKTGIGKMDLYVAFFKMPEAGQSQFYQGYPSFWFEHAANTDVKDGSLSTEPRGITKEENSNENRLFELSPLYYDRDEDLVVGDNALILDELADFLTSNQGAKVAIQVFSSEASHSATYNLYFSVKRAEKIGEYLQQKGVKKDQFTLQGFGDAYPIAAETQGGAPNPAGKKINRRVEFSFCFQQMKQPSTLIVNSPKVSAFMKNPQGDSLRTALQGLSYRVEVASVNTVFSNPVFEAQSDLMVEKESGGKVVHYTCGLHKNWGSAKLEQERLTKIGFETCLIKPYLNGVPLTEDQAPAFLDQFPDLLRWIAGK